MRNNFSLYWWLNHCDMEIVNACSQTLHYNKMGIMDEKKLQESNEKIFENIMYRKNIESILDREQAEEDEIF